MYDFSDYVSSKESFWDMLMNNSIYQCICQWLIIVLLIAILIIAILCLKAVRSGGVSVAKNAGMSPLNDIEAQKVVFCKSCGKQSSAAMKVCPHCGTKRM